MKIEKYYKKNDLNELNIDSYKRVKLNSFCGDRFGSFFRSITNVLIIRCHSPPPFNLNKKTS